MDGTRSGRPFAAQAPSRLPGRLRTAIARRRGDRRSRSPRVLGDAPAKLVTGRFAIAGDFQRTSAAEVWRESNDVGRQRVVAEIAVEKPDFLALLGDLVFHGSSALDWAEFDELMAPVYEAGTPVAPVLGNHEYWLSPRKALDNFFGRFPHLERRHWYGMRYGTLGLLFLDSNAAFLAPSKWDEQRAWFEAELARLDADDAVKGVIVLLHHPPYTNSTVTADEVHVKRVLVPPFTAARKTLAMFAGHVHSYERFQRQGKTFVVTGGGGGPRVRLAIGSRQRHADDLYAGPAVRSLHFLRARLEAEGLSVEVVGLDDAGGDFRTVDRFVLPFSPRIPA